MQLGPNGEIMSDDGEILTPGSDDGERQARQTIVGYQQKIIEACTLLTAVPSQWFLLLKHDMHGELDLSQVSDLSETSAFIGAMMDPKDSITLLNGIIVALKRITNELEETRDEAKRKEGD